ncbi:Rgp1-domain-containing protein [Irpex rosettiformis]|uniref:Rgp1-domain-containing protein n=1 Tax=Irpex rosettiformis TaxID=378272 RepID=A0ACB8TV03_9APHY|nr:Rgp1-domain-containing protein [Irpex rosettiformis]
MLPSTRADEAVQVVVTPSQAAYFAGERLSITITITNTHVPQATVQPHSGSHPRGSHRRGAHSVSYVPMARPPTSPGTKTVLPVLHIKPEPGGTVVVRRGIIGKTRPAKAIDEATIETEHMKRRALPTRSQSMSLSVDNLCSDIPDSTKAKSPIQSLRAAESSTISPAPTRVSSPLTRSITVPAHHPHARKQSVVDGQVQTHLLTSPAPLITPNTSTFSLTLDPIAEGATSPMPPQTPAVSSPVVHEIFESPQIPSSTSAPVTLHTSAETASPQITDDPHPRPLGDLGLGPPPIVVQPPKPRATSLNTATPNHELILYSYAQLSGLASISPLQESPQPLEQARALQTLRRGLMKSKAVGGGSMDITSHNPNALVSNPHLLPHSARRNMHTRASSLSGSLLAMLSPSTLASSASLALPHASRPARHGRSPSVFGSFFQSTSSSSTQMNGLGLSMAPAEEEEEVDDDIPLPTFEVPPSMLAVDLKLGPGESRSYTYELDLPPNLPPSYRGRTLKLSYEFVVGICRASASVSAGSSSRVMKVPIRVYNNVSVSSPPIPYDLLWPSTLRNITKISQYPVAHVVEVRNSSKNYQPSRSPDTSPTLDNTKESLRIYARNLISQASRAAHYAPARQHPVFKVGIGHQNQENVMSEDDVSCREAVEVLTRNPKKLSFDVNKDGIKVAVLTFTKSAYRLGETVLGVVELNARASQARVLKLSALLEAHESLPSSLAQPPPSPSRQLRRVHAEHHSSFMTSTLRTSFSLDIPPDASPAFQIVVPTMAGPPSSGGLEWKIRLSLLVAVASPSAKECVEGLRLKGLIVDGPRGEWGTTWTAARTIAPSERPLPMSPNGDSSLNTPRAAQSWATFLTNAFLGSTEPVGQYHDGDEELDEEDQGHRQEEDWKEVRVEMVECEVPIKVWPGNTAFKATEVVFEV